VSGSLSASSDHLLAQTHYGGGRPARRAGPASRIGLFATRKMIGISVDVSGCIDTSGPRPVGGQGRRHSVDLYGDGLQTESGDEIVEVHQIRIGEVIEPPGR